MGNAWSKHIGEWYAANSGKNGINSLKDAMRSSQCKADFRAKMGGPSMKTEKNVMKKGKKGTRKVKGGSSLSPANFGLEPVPMDKSDTPVVKGGKKGSSLKNVLKKIENSLKKLKGGASGDKTLVIVEEGAGPNDWKINTTKDTTIIKDAETNIATPATGVPSTQVPPGSGQPVSGPPGSGP